MGERLLAPLKLSLYWQVLSVRGSLRAVRVVCRRHDAAGARVRRPIALHPPCESSFAEVGQPHSILLYCTVPNLAARTRLSTAATSSLAGGWASSSEAGQV